MVHNLSDILRYSLGDSRESVTIREEIEITRKYFEIQKLHYPGRIILLWDYDEDVLNYKIIRFVFQPLIENSIKYGLVKDQDRCLIRIKIQEKNDVIKFWILDTGHGMSKEIKEKLRQSLLEEQGEHIGLRNTNKRLILSYAGNPGLVIHSVKERGTVISFQIPKNEGGSHE